MATERDRGLHVSLSTDGAADDGGTVATSSKMVNVWLHGGKLLSLAVETGERIGDEWEPPKPPIDGDDAVSSVGEWVAVPHAAAVEERDAGSAATVLGSAFVLLGTVSAWHVYIVRREQQALVSATLLRLIFLFALCGCLIVQVGLRQSAEAQLHGDDDCKSVFLQAWDPQGRRQLWVQHVGGEHTHEPTRHRELQVDAIRRNASRSFVVPEKLSPLTGDIVVAGPQAGLVRRDCAAGRQLALSVSADQARSMLYAADLSTAQSGYAYTEKAAPNGEQADQYDFSDRVQPKIVALNSKTVCSSPPRQKQEADKAAAM